MRGEQPGQATEAAGASAAAGTQVRFPASMAEVLRLLDKLQSTPAATRSTPRAPDLEPHEPFARPLLPPSTQTRNTDTQGTAAPDRVMLGDRAGGHGGRDTSAAEPAGPLRRTPRAAGLPASAAPEGHAQTPTAGHPPPQHPSAQKPPAADLTLPAEIAGLAGQIEGATLVAAAARAEVIGVGADEVLLAQGLVTPDRICAAAAETLGIGTLALEGETRPEREVAPREFAAILRSGVLRLEDGTLVIAARGRRLRRLAGELDACPERAAFLRLTTPERLAAYLRRHHAGALGRLAAFALLEDTPQASAATLHGARHGLAAAVVACTVLASPLPLLPFALLLVPLALIAVVLLGWSSLRLTASTLPPQVPAAGEALPEAGELPRYSLLVPLYREAGVVPQLVAALEALGYPREKLQVLLVIEPDDGETAAALLAHAVRPGFEIVTAPALGPRTKPKALNAALPFARGSIVGIYDAEDMPDPRQLRRAAAVFAGPGGRRVGCVQARLAIDNDADGWITRQFAAEYAAHFDVVLPLIAHARLPVPLGGTSNHFRRAALEEVGGWDPFNVAEDADLGLRLARAGWRTAMIASSTDEEAPRRPIAWLRQRTRWYKGWMQTLLVHGREPRRLVAELGLLGALSAVFLLGGGLASALMHPVFALGLVLHLATERSADGSLASALLDGLGVAVLTVGYGATFACTLVGMRHRRLSGAWRVLPMIPLYWLLLSLAAWRALAQLVRAPFHWEKTEHGLARSSRRRGRGRGRALTDRDAAPRRRRPATA